jgi:hypothetical protein
MAPRFLTIPAVARLLLRGVGRALDAISKADAANVAMGDSRGPKINFRSS